jgi:hypothetical protein
VMFRQVLHQNTHVGERRECRYCRDHDPLRQVARPIRL